MADIKIREGSLRVTMRGQTIEDDTHPDHGAVHIQFQDVGSTPIANYTFVDGQLKGYNKVQLTHPQRQILLDFESPRGEDPGLDRLVGESQ